MIADVPGPFETTATSVCRWIGRSLRALAAPSTRELPRLDVRRRDALSPREHASAFLRATIEPGSPRSSITLSRLNDLYDEWCGDEGYAPLPPKQLGLELNEIVSALSLPYEVTDNDVIIRKVRARSHRFPA